MKPRIIKLFCPSASKTVSFVAWDKQRLNLGSIAWTFGLDPATLKLNGHFISRGVDLFASSVTWNNLLSFFSARGLCTGKNDQDALVVDGKLIKVGTKRKLSLFCSWVLCPFVWFYDKTWKDERKLEFMKFYFLFALGWHS